MRVDGIMLIIIGCLCSIIAGLFIGYWGMGWHGTASFALGSISSVSIGRGLVLACR